VAAGTRNRGAARPVVPVRRGVELSAAPIETDQQFLDQQSIIEDDIHY
jgi:hypothetical protein